jgi:hypothetical protein
MDMSGRALSLATAMLLVGLAAPFSLIAPVSAQNLEAGKSPAQLFAGNCSVCHKSARGLLKTVPPGQLPSFLRQHYTTSADMAKIMSSYVVANGAGGGRRPNDDNLTRRGRELTREQAPADAAPAGRQRPAAAERQQAQPGPDGEPAPRRGRNSRRQPPAEAATPAGEAQAPAAAETERPVAPRQKGKKNRRHQEEPKADTVKEEAKPEADKAEPATSEPPKAEPVKPEPAKSEPPKEAAPAKPAEESKPAETAKPEPKPEPKPEAPAATRADPVPAVTPAPKEPEPAPSAPAAPPTEPAKPAE